MSANSPAPPSSHCESAGLSHTNEAWRWGHCTCEEARDTTLGHGVESGKEERASNGICKEMKKEGWQQTLFPGQTVGNSECPATVKTLSCWHWGTTQVPEWARGVGRER